MRLLRARSGGGLTSHFRAPTSGLHEQALAAKRSVADVRPREPAFEIVGDVLDYLDHPVRQDLWRAGHAHAGVLLILALVTLRYVADARVSGPWRRLAGHGIPVAAATEPSVLIALVPVGGLLLVGGVASLGIGLLRPPGTERSG